MSNSFRVRVGNQNAIKVVSSNLATEKQSVAGITFDFTGIQDNYVLQYDASSQKIIAVNPDQVLSDAASDGSIPGNFINVLDTDTTRPDNIDFDGGNF